MTRPITEDDWRAVRAALGKTADRFAGLLRTLPDPGAPAIGMWSAAETAAHVATVAWLYTTMVPPERTPHPIPGIDDRVSVTTLTDIAGLNETTLRHLRERDPRSLAERLHADIDFLMRTTEIMPPDQPISWLGGARLPVAGVFAHLLNELLIHGHDIARAAGIHWKIPSADAAMAVELFLFTMLGGDTGVLLPDGKRTDRGSVAIEFRSRYTSPVVLLAREGRMFVENGARRVDAHVFFDPAKFMLMLFGRISGATAILTGGVVAWGRRPWLLPAFLRTVHLP